MIDFDGSEFGSLIVYGSTVAVSLPPKAAVVILDWMPRLLRGLVTGWIA